MKVEPGSDGGGFLWLRMDHGPDDTAASKTGWDAPAIRDTAWHTYTVTAEVPADATWYVFGVRLTGRAALWVDDFVVEARAPGGDWHPIPVRDARFDDAERWWVFDGFGYDAEVVEDAGERVLQLRHQDLDADSLFPDLPALGEAFEEAIGARLVARVPLALPAGAPVPAALARTPVPPERDDPAVRVAAAMVAWNVLRHFHPYAEDVAVDWDATLRHVLERALAAPDRASLVSALWALQGGGRGSCAGGRRPAHRRRAPRGRAAGVRFPKVPTRLRGRAPGDGTVWEPSDVHVRPEWEGG